MDEPTFIINGHPFDLVDMQVTMMVVWRVPNEGIMHFLGGTLNDIKRHKTKLCLLFDAPFPCALGYLAELAGFQLNGCFKGTLLFTGRDKTRLLQIAPWVKLS